MDRKRIALYSYLALLAGLVGVFVRVSLTDPYSDQPAGLGYAFPILLMLTAITFCVSGVSWLNCVRGGSSAVRGCATSSRLSPSLCRYAR